MAHPGAHRGSWGLAVVATAALLAAAGCAHGAGGVCETTEGRVARTSGHRRLAAQSGMGLVGLLARIAPATEAHREQPRQAKAGAKTPSDLIPEKDRMDLFHALVAAVKAMHVFTPQTERNLGHGWEADLPRLSRLFRAAETKQALMSALWQFGNSLHNPHCHYSPPSRPKHITTGLFVAAEWISGKPQFYVARVRGQELAKQVRPGDIVVSFDGILASEFLRRLDLWSNANNRFALAAQIADRLSHRPWVGRLPGPSHWTLRHRNGTGTFTVTTPWRPTRPPKLPKWNEIRLDYQHLSCPGRPRHYGPYRLTAVGVNFCFYQADKAPYKAYPIVRQHIFYYAYEAPWMPKDSSWLVTRRLVAADRDHLARLLARAGRIRGVILDLRGNHGGNNPNWFLDWWAPAPYRDHFVFTRLHPKLAARYRRALKHSTNATFRAIAASYLEAFDHRQPGQRFAPKRTFFCLPGNCHWSNRYEPHPITEAPVALLVGPGCVSSCDHVAQIFADYGFGPVVGSPTAAGYTVERHRVQLSLGPGRPLGTMTLAVTYEVSGKTGRPVEAVPLALTRRIDETFRNRQRYDRILVDAAIRQLRRGRWPRPSRRRTARRR